MGQTTNANAAQKSAPVSILRAVTRSDTVDLPNGPCDALWIGTGGDVAVIAENDTVAVTLPNAGSGQIIPVKCKRVMLTNTLAANIVAMYD